MAEYRKGSGPKELPQGAAGAANAATPSAYPQVDIPVQYATPSDHPQMPPDGQNDNLDILTAPPHPDYQSPLVPQTQPNVVPQTVVRNLPRMMAAANDPDAPETVKALYRSIVFELERQRS